MVVIDEAYHHFVTQSDIYASFIDRPIDDERVIVARTFSKVYGLAGLRMGYAVGCPESHREDETLSYPRRAQCDHVGKWPA